MQSLIVAGQRCFFFHRINSFNYSAGDKILQNSTFLKDVN